MNTTTARPNGARRRRRLTAPLLLMAPTVAAALLLNSAATNPATISGSHIELVKTTRDLVALEPRDHRGDGPAPAPSPGGPVPTGKKKFDSYNYYQCIQNHNNHAQDCCLMSDGVWTKDETCVPQRMGSSLPGGTGFPTEAVDTGSPQQGSPPLPPVAVDPGSPQSPPVTTPPPVVRDHRTP